jgi:hypothetical protein
VAESWRRLHNEELRNLYASPNIIRVIKSKRMRLVGHVARMGAMRNSYSISVRKSEGKRPLGRSRHRWKRILEWILEKWCRKMWTGFIRLRIGTSNGLL